MKQKLGLVLILMCTIGFVGVSPVSAASKCKCTFSLTPGALDLGNATFKKVCASGWKGATCDSCDGGTTMCTHIFDADLAKCDAAGADKFYESSIPGSPNAGQATCAIMDEGALEATKTGNINDKTPGSGAVSTPALKPVVLVDPMGGKGIIGAISSLISVFLGMVGAIALLVFVYAGVVYMTAGGADDRVTHAKDTMKYALIGLALITFAYALTNFYFVALTS